MWKSNKADENKQALRVIVGEIKCSAFSPPSIYWTIWRNLWPLGLQFREAMVTFRGQQRRKTRFQALSCHTYSQLIHLHCRSHWARFALVPMWLSHTKACDGHCLVPQNIVVTTMFREGNVYIYICIYDIFFFTFLKLSSNFSIVLCELD